MAQIYRIGNDIYDAATKQRIPDVATLQSKYRWATEVSQPWINQPKQQTANSTPMYGASDWRSTPAMQEAARKIIEIRTGNNKDITEADAAWQTRFRDAAAFWTSNVSDKNFQLMSPEDQASIRSARETAALAQINALDKERATREQMWWTALTTVKESTENRRQALQKEEELKADREYKNSLLWLQRQNNLLELYKSWVWDYWVNNKWEIVPVDKTKVISSGWKTYDFWYTWPSWIYATDEKWWNNVSSIMNSIPEYWTMEWKSSRFQNTLEAYIERKYPNSIFVPYVNDIVNQSIAKWVDPRLALSIAIAEWAFNSNTNKPARTWNPFNVWNVDSWAVYTKGTIQDKIGLWIDKIARSEIKSGLWGTNNYTTTQLNALAKRLTQAWQSVSVADLKKMSSDDIISLDASISAQNTPSYKVATSDSWTKVAAKYGISTDIISATIEDMATQSKESIISELNNAWLDWKNIYNDVYKLIKIK